VSRQIQRTRERQRRKHEFAPADRSAFMQDRAISPDGYTRRRLRNAARIASSAWGDEIVRAQA
jgi:hypothetical protein